MQETYSQEKLLRINLTTQKIAEEPIPSEWVKRYIGGKGLASRYMLKEIAPKTDPLSPSNKIFIVGGPLTSTLFPTTNRYGLLFKSPLTRTYAESYSGGFVGQKIRNCGYFMIVIEGRSSTPVVLEISEKGVEFKDGSALWGKDTFHTYETLVGDNIKEKDIICIGPAGENLVRFASVQNNLFHSAGRCGPGAVFGSKNLKAIVFKGKSKPALNKDPEFRELVKEILSLVHNKPDLYGKKGVYREFGTPSIVDWANELGCFPTRYFSEGFSKFSENFNAHAINEKILKKRTGCWNCPFTCSKYVEVKEGPFKAQIEGPEYETIAVFAGICDIREIEPIVKINEFCDRMGIDTISAGNICGLAIEAKKRMRISHPDLENLDYNKPLEVLEFLNKIVLKEGIGKDFAMGTKFVSQKYHLEDFAMHVKGLEFAGYDPRAFRAFAISYGVAPEGPTHLRSVYHGKERHLPNRLSYENRIPPMVAEEDRMAIIDSLIVCKFLRGILDWPILVKIYNTLFKTNINEEELRRIAHTIVTMSRVFNVREGFSRKDDYMPPRAYSETLVTPSGLEFGLSREGYDKMLDEYYAIRGWSKEGIPPEYESGFP